MDLFPIQCITPTVEYPSSSYYITINCSTYLIHQLISHLNHSSQSPLPPRPHHHTVSSPHSPCHTISFHLFLTPSHPHTLSYSTSSPHLPPNLPLHTCHLITHPLFISPHIPPHPLLTPSNIPLHPLISHLICPSTQHSSPHTTSSLPHATSSSPQSTSPPPHFTSSPPQSNSSPPHCTSSPSYSTSSPPDTTSSPSLHHLIPYALLFIPS